MTRPFRLEEDERRYFALRSEFFVRLVQSGAHPQTVHEIMRNFGKLEDFAFYEGVRQGMAVAALCRDAARDEDLDPLTLHALAYRGGSTPLVRMERSATGAELEGHPWLDEKPLEFGPLTLNEAIEMYGADLQVRPAAPVSKAARRVEPAEPAEAPIAPPEDFDAMAALDALANGADPKVVFAHLGANEELLDAQDSLQGLIEMPPDDELRPLERPALLDRIRDILLRLDAPPRTWADMVLLLMRETRTDASYLDDLLSTPMGMTVISQANLFHLHPGAMPEVKRVDVG